jgi:WD40 repeat protein
MAVFDSTGLVFAVTASMTADQGHFVHLYDARNYADGAFAELKLMQEDLEKSIQTQNPSLSLDQATILSKDEWTSLQFNKSGSQILVGTEKGMSIVLDGFEGTVQRVFSSSTQTPAVSCFSSDDKTLLMGNEDGSVSCWNVETGAMVKRLEGHPGPVRCLASNPKYTQFASACKQTALWTWDVQ